MLYRQLGIDAGGSGCNAAFPFDKGVLKMKKMNYPADYAVLSNEEMTYTTGGGAVDNAAGLATTAATVVGAVVLASSYIWGIKQARTWLQQDGNKDGNFFTVMGRAGTWRIYHKRRASPCRTGRWSAPRWAGLPPSRSIPSGCWQGRSR